MVFKRIHDIISRSNLRRVSDKNEQSMAMHQPQRASHQRFFDLSERYECIDFV